MPYRRLAIAFGLLIVAACGSDAPLTQPAARDKAATAVCDWAARCGNIGDGKTYATRDACLTTWKADIQNRWPPEMCPKIVQAEFDTCMNSIKDATCNNFLVDLIAVLSRCGSDMICTTAP